jgi:hypothetical protein
MVWLPVTVCREVTDLAIEGLMLCASVDDEQVTFSHHSSLALRPIVADSFFS